MTQPVPHVAGVATAHWKTVLTGTQLQTEMAIVVAVQPLYMALACQRIAMNPQQVFGEAFFQLPQWRVSERLSALMNHRDVFLVGLTVQDLGQRDQFLATQIADQKMFGMAFLIL